MLLLRSSLLCALSGALLSSVAAGPLADDVDDSASQLHERSLAMMDGMGADDNASRLEKRYTTLADGTYMQSGSISSTFKWQASGKLSRGGCSSSYGIKNCYSMYLQSQGNFESTKKPAAKGSSSSSSSLFALNSVSSWAEKAAANDDDLDAYFRAFPDQLEHYEPMSGLIQKRQVVKNCSSGDPGPPKPPSPRQRIELFSWPGAKYGETWTYRWKSRTSTTSTSTHFNHLWQILRRDACGGPVLTLDIKNGVAQVFDVVRKKRSASIPVSRFFGRTISHTMTIKYGIKGTVNYSAVEAGKPKSSLLRYSAKGDMGSSASLKFGMYREASRDAKLRPGHNFVGDYTAKRVS